jgi:hypothetical protein
MTTAQLTDTHGTAQIPGDDVISRSMQIFKTVAEVNRAWENAGLPGEAQVTPASGNRGAVLKVELPKDDKSSYEHALSLYEGKSTSQRLESALRTIKGKLETGEVATTSGQPSGRGE